MVSDGLLNKQIAHRLNLSEVTVKIHRAQAMHKMNTSSVAEVVKKLQRVLPSLIHCDYSDGWLEAEHSI